jgi:hypothetical protein
MESITQRLLSVKTIGFIAQGCVRRGITAKQRIEEEIAECHSEGHMDVEDSDDCEGVLEAAITVLSELVDSANQIGVDATMKKFPDESDVGIFESLEAERKWLQDELDIQDNEMAFDLATIEEDRFEKIVAQVREIRAELKSENADDK